MTARIFATHGAGAASLSRRFTWQHLALFLVTAVVLYLTLVPLIIIFFGTFTSWPPGTAAALTFKNYIRAFGDPALLYSGARSVLFATTSGLIAFVIGGFLAWVTERTNTPLKPVLYGLALFPFVVPSILTTIAWIFLLAPNVGVV